MRKFAFLTLTLVLTIFTGCNNDDDNTAEQTTLSQQETDDLKVLREEEKLARDVYLFSYDKYGESIFNSVASSEQKHMDKMLTLLNTYGIQDPALSERGNFTNQELQTLYNDLTTKSAISLIDALEVGATIEDLDIRDIKIFKNRATKADILDTYDKLECGSRNHMRSYYGKLLTSEVTYVAQYISATELAEIINASNEQCGN